MTGAHTHDQKVYDDLIALRDTMRGIVAERDAMREALDDIVRIATNYPEIRVSEVNLRSYIQNARAALDAAGKGGA